MPTGRREFLKHIGAAGAVLAGGSVLGPALASCGSASTSSAGSGYSGGGNRLEIFSWWTSGGEVQALDALYGVYRKQHPKIHVVNAALAGGAGAGGNMKAVLKTRMLGNDPPDSFQVHLGAELIQSWVVIGKMLPIDNLYNQMGLKKVLPSSLVEIASWKGKPYSVPVNIHRGNLIWYNKPLLSKAGGTPPKTWADFFTVAEKLKAQGIPAIGLAEATPGSMSRLLESILIAEHGPKGYRGLFTGHTSWSGQGVTKALQTAVQALQYANPDYLSVQGANQPDLIAKGKVAMIIDGDWTNGLLKAEAFTDYGWAPSPETDGIYDLVSDSFGLPKGAKDASAAMDWLKVIASKAGQDAFNPPKGSISARSDRGTDQYDDYQMWAVQQWEHAKALVPALEDGSAAGPTFLTDYDNITNGLATNKNVSDAQSKLVQAAQNAHFSSQSS